MEKPPRIICAAILMDDGLIVTGVRHYSPDMRATLKRIYGSRRLFLFGRWLIKPYHIHEVEQGFIDSRGNFLNRKDAWVRAQLTNQIPHQGEIRAELYSEDLY